MPTVAIASEFLDAFARIPRAQQRKVREFTEKFRTNPKAPGINYEKLHAVSDAEEAVATGKKTKEPGLLDAYPDDVLLSFGVPEALVPSVRAVKTQDAL